MKKSRRLLFCTTASLSLASAQAWASGETVTIPADEADPPGYVCILKRVGNGKGTKEVKVCSPKPKEPHAK